MKILCVGDIVGEPGREAIRVLVPKLKEEMGVDCVIANAENAAAGMGLTPRLAKQLFESGCNALTLGDHTWDKPELMLYFSEEARIIRPANFPEGAPGCGWMVVDAPGGKIAIINLLGRVFMRYNVDCPFKALEKIVQELKKQTRVIIVDMHAEATSEKIALGHFIDGQVSLVFGTHTHVQTADEKILPQGTAYITDLGMTGPHDSVIGQEKNKIIKRFLTSLPNRFEVASDDIRLNGVILDVDPATGRAQSITRIQKVLR